MSKRQWKTVRAVVEVAVHSDGFAPYTDKDLAWDLKHLVGGSQLNERNAKLPRKTKVSFGTVQVKEAFRVVDKIQREMKQKAQDKIKMLERRVQDLST